jgi:hypothetical protein
MVKVLEKVPLFYIRFFHICNINIMTVLMFFPCYNSHLLYRSCIVLPHRVYKLHIWTSKTCLKGAYFEAVTV